MVTDHKMFEKKTATPETMVRVGVGVFVTDGENRLLLERRADCGMWGLLGGKIDPGESVAEAGLREVMEEAGLEIRITRFIGVYSEPADRIVTYPDNGDVVQLVDVVLEAEIIGGHLQISPESLELKFFKFDELPSDIVPPAVQPISDFLNGCSCILR